jgi:uncharacterized oligopeptide transporter (OPT) family protein
VPLAFLVGFAASISPAFADMGYDLKAGWILRGRGTDSRFERSGRRAQLAAELLGIGVAAIVVLLVHASYFERDLFPPYDRVAVATISAGASPSLAKALILWSIPGALLQLTGGPARQLGVLLATGLLIDFRAAGWTAMVSSEPAVRRESANSHVRSRRRLHRGKRPDQLRRRHTEASIGTEGGYETAAFRPLLGLSALGDAPVESISGGLRPRIRNADC